MLLGVERPFVGAFAPGGPGAALLHRNGLVRAVLPASARTCANGQGRFPRNLGDPVVSSEIPGRRYRVTNSRPRRRTRPPRSELKRVRPRYRQAKATKCGGTEGRKSQCLDSTEEAGELGPRGPG